MANYGSKADGQHVFYAPVFSASSASQQTDTSTTSAAIDGGSALGEGLWLVCCDVMTHVLISSDATAATTDDAGFSFVAPAGIPQRVWLDATDRITAILTTGTANAWVYRGN